MFKNISRRNKECTGIMLIFSLFFLIGGFGTADGANLLEGLRVNDKRQKCHCD